MVLLSSPQLSHKFWRQTGPGFSIRHCYKQKAAGHCEPGKASAISDIEQTHVHGILPCATVQLMLCSYVATCLNNSCANISSAGPHSNGTVSQSFGAGAMKMLLLGAEETEKQLSSFTGC